jgi:hypothetical protein
MRFNTGQSRDASGNRIRRAAMDAERRQQLEQRRRFLRPRIVGDRFRNNSRANPAYHELERAGETFAFFALGEEPAWTPDWWPMSYSRVPWDRFPDAHVTRGGLDPADVRTLVIDMLSARLGPADRMLVCGQLILELKFAAFERHYDAVMKTFGWRAHIAAPPAR